MLTATSSASHSVCNTCGFGLLVLMIYVSVRCTAVNSETDLRWANWEKKILVCNNIFDRENLFF